MKKLFIPFLLLIFLGSSCQVKKLFTPKSGNSYPNKNTPAVRPLNGVSKNTAEIYIEKYKFIAVAEMNANGIPASITLAQGLLESGNGNSDLAIQANNHFGIKCAGDWKGKSILKDDDEEGECFRVYNNAEESYKDHSEFLKRKRYAPLFELRKDDYQAWAKGLKEAGYATNPKYPELLISLIERYSLHLYDDIDRPADRVKREESVLTEIAKEVPQEMKTEAVKAPVSMKIYEVKDGDTLYAIAKQFGLSLEELKLINNIYTDKLNLGQLLVVSK